MFNSTVEILAYHETPWNMHNLPFKDRTSPITCHLSAASCIGIFQFMQTILQVEQKRQNENPKQSIISRNAAQEHSQNTNHISQVRSYLWLILLHWISSYSLPYVRNRRSAGLFSKDIVAADIRQDHFLPSSSQPADLQKIHQPHMDDWLIVGIVLHRIMYGLEFTHPIYIHLLLVTASFQSAKDVGPCHNTWTRKIRMWSKLLKNQNSLKISILALKRQSETVYSGTYFPLLNKENVLKFSETYTFGLKVLQLTSFNPRSFQYPNLIIGRNTTP